MPSKTKQTNAHHIRRLHRHRARWFVGLAVGLVTIQVVAYHTQPTNQHVLAYATNVNISALASATNQQRASNGLGALALNSQLNSGARSKADHMIAHNYWSHTAPDGTEPWHFFDQTGYNYQHAGENLAYGFDSSSEIVDAWMNSPGHRANVLGDYKDMGFGFADGQNYQGSENTVVVAFYGTQQGQSSSAPAEAPAPSTPATQPAQTTAPVETPTTDEPAPEPEATPAPSTEPATSEPEPEPVSTVSTEPTEPKSVTNLENILAGNASWPMYASLGLIATATAGFAATHWQLVRRGWRQSAHFILVHPALDTAILIALLATLLTASAGFIR